MEERKTYEVALTSRQKSTLDKLLEVVWDDDCVELREIKQDDETVKEEDFPKFGDNYWYYDAWGVCNETFQEDSIDKRLLETGCCFKTKEEAEFELERMKVVTEMKKFAEPKNRVWSNNLSTSHFYIGYDHAYKKVVVYSVSYIQSNDIYFETVEKAEECINHVGEDRIKKYYLRIDN